MCRPNILELLSDLSFFLATCFDFAVSRSRLSAYCVQYCQYELDLCCKAANLMYIFINNGTIKPKSNVSQPRKQIKCSFK